MSTTYEFDDAFQKKVVAMMLRDEVFTSRVDGLVIPEYFDNGAYTWLANVVNGHFQKYRQTPSGAIVMNEIRDAKAKGRIKPEFVDELKDVLKYVYNKPDLSSRDYTAEKVAEFARERSIEEGLLASAEIMDKKGDFSKIRDILNKALDVGTDNSHGSLDISEGIADRINMRVAALSSTSILHGITTGHPEFDKAFYHHGWGRKELSCIAGAPKGGKSIGLQYFAVKAAEAGHNVLFVTLENSAKITIDRMDANITDTKMNELATKAARVEAGLKAFAKKSGILKVHEEAGGSMKPSDLRRLIRRFQSQSILFDLVVVDYADEMAPEVVMNEERFNLNSIFQALRRLAVEENIAVLTATQLNKEGSKSNTATKNDMAESFGKSRLVDLLLTINADADEKSRQEMRLYMAASRNSEDECGWLCKQDRSKMRFVTRVLDRF